MGKKKIYLNIVPPDFKAGEAYKMQQQQQQQHLQG